MKIKSNGLPNGDQTLHRQEEKFLTLKELCSLFRIDKRTVYSMVKNGMPEYRFSERKAMYEYNEVKSFLLNNKK